MGPVSFQLIAKGLERSDALRLAGKLAAAGISAQLVDGDRALLVRSADASRAKDLITSGDENC